jgi:DNA-binding GntR family transcriptional regulator
VYEALREKILSGVYAPGSRLILSRLANEHEMSFIPVREALQRLEGERMVRSERNRGATVTELSIDDMRDIYETRLILEDAAIRAATASIDERQLERAERALERMGASFLEGHDRQAYAWHQEFHFALYEPAGSAWTLHLIRLLWTSAERYMRLAASVRPEAEQFVAEHAEILRAVQAGDADEAAERLADNLRTTARLLGETYEAKAAPGG